MKQQYSDLASYLPLAYYITNDFGSYVHKVK